MVEASAASGRGQQWRSDAFALGSSAAAARVLTGWRRVHHAQRVAVGVGGAVFVQRSRRRAVVQVLWRDGTRLGLLALTATRNLSKAREEALAYTALADSYLKTPLPTTSWARVLDRIRPNGTVSEQTALQAFVLAYGPVPGVHPPRGPIGKIPDGTMAAEWVLRYRSRLSRRQLRAVDRLLGIPPPGARRGADVAGPPNYGDPGWEEDPHLDDLAHAWVRAFDAKFAMPLPLSVVAGYTDTVQKNPYTGGLSAGDARPFTAGGGYGSGDPQICVVRIFPAGTGGSVSSEIAHEVFHCFEFFFLGDKAWYDAPAAWIMEGLAVWGQLSVDTTTPNGYVFLMNDYVTSPRTPLFTRAYDAVGFWGHAQDTVGSLWTRIPYILRAGGDQASFQLAGGDTTDLLSSWGSSVFNGSPADLPWTMVSPIRPSAKPTPEIIRPAVVGGGQHAVAAPAYTTAQYIVGDSPDDPLLHLTISGSARLSTLHNFTDLEDTWFCTSSEPCECPPGASGTIPPTRPLLLPNRLALTGDPDKGTEGEVVAYPLSFFCHSKTPPPGPGGGGTMGCRSGGCASSSGDPHLLTFAGDYYDFQAAGEFTLLKSTTDDLEIQERQRPFPGSSDVAVNTAVAMRVAHATVEVDTGHSIGSLVVWVNRRRVKALRSERLRGGGELSPNGAGVTVSWPDGTTAQVFSGITFTAGASANALNVAVKVARARAGHLTGLLGDAGAASGTEFVGRNGRRYSLDVARGDSPANFKLLYHSFGRSWRIRQHDSLFVYPHGKSTSSYTIASFPSKPENVLSLSPTAFTTGERACHKAGVVDAAVLDGCIVDVGATGDTGFAAGAAHLQGLTGGLPPAAGGVSPVAWTELSSARDTDTLLTPSLASAGARMVAAYRARSDTSIATATFTPTSTGIGAVGRSIPFTGWSSIYDPLLFRAPGGGLQMIFEGTNSSAALNGTLISQRQPNGAFGPANNTNSGPESNLARGAALASDGMTPVWTATYGPYLKLERGAHTPHETDLSSLVPGAAYVPTLAHDQGGRLWMAWYEIANNPARSGLYLLKLDPSGDGVAPGASPELAPASQASDNNTAQPALACATVCRLVYEDSRTNTQLDSWTPGQTRPSAIASDSRGLGDPTATYTTDGQLWVTWVEPHSDRLLAKLGDATGAGGSPILLQTPRGYSTALNTTSTVDGTRLVLATNWQTDSSTPTTAVFATVINAAR